MAIKTIEKISDLVNYLESFDIQENVCFFRGHADEDYKLAPSIYRKNEWCTNEDKIIREILTRCPNEFLTMKTAFEKLVKMQHYNIPTRLLDITENPLVALYFACVGKKEEGKDAELLIFKIPRREVKYFDSDTVSVVANVAWAAPSNFEVHDMYSTSSESFHNSKNIHALKLLHDIRQEKPHFLERINPDHIQSVVCVKPKLDNARVVRQDGAFLLFGIEKDKRKQAQIPENWMPNSPERLVIKAGNKKNVLRQLASIGISKAKLFPEIDSVAQFIKDDFELKEVGFQSTFSPMAEAPRRG